MGDIAVQAVGLGKAYQIGIQQEKYRNFRDAIVDAAVGPFRRMGRILRGDSYGASHAGQEFWALRDLSFEVKHGEVVGIIGRNGAGKSTLLKILSRITEPTEGYADIYGRIGALLEVGTGFHPELTGRENIYLNGTILGMGRKEIERKFDEIVAFAEVEKFIDTPVKHYSSGMGLRLGFAVAAHLEPEILVIDEVLAVGDTEFQRKCIGKMGDVAKEGRTVLFVSHNMGAVQALCQRGIVLDHGGIVFMGSQQDAINEYLTRNSSTTLVPLTEREDRRGSGSMRFTGIKVLNGYGAAVDAVAAGDDITIELEYEMQAEALRNVVFQITFQDKTEQILFVCLTRTVDQNFTELPKNSVVRCKIPDFPLAPDTYTISIIAKENSTLLADKIMNAMLLTVTSGDFFGTGKVTPSDCGPFMVRHSWQLETKELETR